MSTPGAPNPYLHGRTPATVHQDYSGRTLPGQTRSNQQWAAREIYENSEGRNLMNDFGRPSQRTPPSTPPRRGGTRRQRGVIRRGKKTKRSKRSHKKTRRARKKSKSHHKRR